MSSSIAFMTQPLAFNIVPNVPSQPEPLHSVNPVPIQPFGQGPVQQNIAVSAYDVCSSLFSTPEKLRDTLAYATSLGINLESFDTKEHGNLVGLFGLLVDKHLQDGELDQSSVFICALPKFQRISQLPLTDVINLLVEEFPQADLATTTFPFTLFFVVIHESRAEDNFYDGFAPSLHFLVERCPPTFRSTFVGYVLSSIVNQLFPSNDLKRILNILLDSYDIPSDFNAESLVSRLDGFFEHIGLMSVQKFAKVVRLLGKWMSRDIALYIIYNKLFSNPDYIANIDYHVAEAVAREMFTMNAPPEVIKSFIGSLDQFAAIDKAKMWNSATAPIGNQGPLLQQPVNQVPNQAPNQGPLLQQPVNQVPNQAPNQGPVLQQPVNQVPNQAPNQGPVLQQPVNQVPNQQGLSLFEQVFNQAPNQGPLVQPPPPQSPSQLPGGFNLVPMGNVPELPLPAGPQQPQPAPSPFSPNQPSPSPSSPNQPASSPFSPNQSVPPVNPFK